MWILLTAVIFFFIGRFSVSLKKNDKETIDDIVNKFNSYKPKIGSGTIKFITPEDKQAQESGDKALEQHWIKSGIASKVTGQVYDSKKE